MVNEKAKIIRKLGASAIVKYADGSTKTVKFLVGRASTVFNSMLSLEAHRKGDFLVEDSIEGGCLVTNILTNEVYLTVANYPSVFKDKILSILFHMLVTNARVTLKRDEKVADDNGNITVNPVDIVTDMEVYCEAVNQDLNQYKPGIALDAEYLVYAPKFDVTLLDKLILSYSNTVLPLKVVFVDDITFPGICVVQVKTETRE